MTNLLIEDIDPAMVPEKFKNPETGAVRMEALVKSYSELEKKLSSGPSAPASPDEYCIECKHGMFEPDAEVNARLHAKGMSQEQAQEVYDLAAERMIPMLKEISNDVKADREVEKLIEKFGGPEKWKQVSKQLLAFGQRNLPADVFENLRCYFFCFLHSYELNNSFSAYYYF